MRTIGIDLGGTNVYAVVLDDDKVVGEAKRKTPPDDGRKGVMKAIVKAAQNALDDADVTGADATGVGSPGVVTAGTVGGASNVAGFDERFDLAGTLQDQLDMPVRAINDVTAAAVGEHAHGAGKGADHVFAVFVGTGVGGGLVLNGKPFEGVHGAAGEFGHMVVRQDGEVCPCGRRGCVEAYAGRRAMTLAAERLSAAGTDTILFDVMEEKGKPRTTSGVFQEALSRGDTLVADLLDEAVSTLGASIASVVNLLDLERVVLGGGMSEKLGETFRARIEAAMRPQLFMDDPRVEVVLATLGDPGGAIGAARAARDTFAKVKRKG